MCKFDLRYLYMSMPAATTSSASQFVLVDDDQLTLEIVSWNLRKTNYASYLFQSHEKALLHLQQGAPRLLIVDYYMPLMTGVEFLHKASDICQLQVSTILLCTALEKIPSFSEVQNTFNISRIDKEQVCDRKLLEDLLLTHLS